MSNDPTERRFDAIENRITALGTEVRILIALVVVAGGLNVAHFFLGR